MYDGYIGSGKFGYYRDILGKIYQGEDVSITFDELIDKIELDYAEGKLSDVVSAGYYVIKTPSINRFF